MADSGSFNADLGINMQFNIDGAGLVEMTKTIKEISKGKDLQRYWKDVEAATDSAAKAIERYNKNTQSKGLAENFLKQINALKAITNKENMTDIFPNMDINFDELIESAKKLAPKINAEFSSSNFSQAFKTFDLLKDKGIELGEVFSKLADYSSKVDENFKLRRENNEFRDLFGEQDIDKIKKDLSEIQKLRNEAEETFNNFLSINKIEKTDYWGDEQFSEYFNGIRNGSLTATEAIAKFKTEYRYLLEKSFKSNNDTFGLDQLQAFSTKLDSIFHQVEETSNKINDILSNGVIAKSVQNLSEDTTLSDSQRSIFGNILQDEESLKSITALFQKLIDETNQPKNTEIFNTEQFTKIESLFTSIESSLSSIKGVLVDVGDGEELSPLLKQLDNIREATSNIKLSLNLDLGNEVSERLNQKVSQSTQRQLEAYRKLFSAMKGTGKTNKEMLKFFEPDEASATELIGAYQGIIKRAEEKFKVGNSNIYKKLLGSTYDDLKKEIKNANAQLGRAENKRSENGILGDLFGNSKDLSGVIEQLNTIVSKLDEISVSAKGFTETFKNGLNVNASVEEIEKLTNRVKELETELAKIKTPTALPPEESNISSGTKDVFPDSSTDAKPEIEGMEQVEKATEEAVQAKKEFATANEGVQSSIDGSENPLKLEAELMDQITKSAREAANAKKEFVEANKQVKDSADGSNNDLADGHFENAESSGVKKYKKKGYKAHDTGNHDNEKKVLNKAELGKALKDLQSEIIASIDESTSFIKEVTDFYDSQDNLVKTQMKVGDKNGSMRTYTTSYSMDKDGNATAWTSHIETQKIAEQTKQEEKLTQAMAKGREQSEKTRQAEQKRQELAQNNAINKALEEEYRQRQKLAQEEEKQIQKNKELAMSYTESASKKLSDAISKYSYGDSSDATAMMKQMNRGLSNFGDLSNIESNIKNFDSIVDTIITDLKHSHEESLFALNNEIKAEETMQKQKDAFNKSNLNAIDMEIKKREEEAKAFSNSLKAQMESQQQAESQMSKFENTLSKYQTKTSGYNATIARFNDGGWTSDEYLDNVQAVKDAVKKYEDLLNNIRAKGGITSEEDIQNLKEYESEIKNTIATVTNMSAAEKGYNFVSGQKELDKIHKLLNENSKMSSEAKAKIKAYYTEIESGNPSMSLDRIHGEIMKIYNAEVEAGRAGRSFFDTLKNSGFHQLAAQMSGMFGFYDVINLIKQAASAVTELNTQITELAKVSEDSVSQIYADFDSYANIAKEMGSTISDTIAATTAWSKNGYNIPDSKELAEVSLLYKNVGDGINIDEANESLVSTLKGFKLEADQAEHIVDVFNEVSNREPISSSGIGEALQRSAASFNAANTSLEKSVALVTATNSVLQDPEKVGNMWKTVSARIRGAKTELEEAGEDTDGMVESTSKLQALIKGMTGFDIMESDGKTFKDIYDIIIGIGEKWQDLNDVDRASLLEKLAGKNQSNALAAAISQVDVLKKAYGEATNAEGSAREENSKYQQSVQYSIDQTKAKLEELANDTLNSKFLKGLINAGGKIIDILDIIIKNVGILKPLLAGLAIKNIVQNFD